MPSTRAMPFRLTLGVAIAAIALLGEPAAGAHDHARHAASKAEVSSAELALRQEMRRLWEDHITWTRLAIISLTTDAPDTDATVGRLLRNQTDLGNAIKPYYGAAAGKQLTALLREHILIAADVIAAARKGDADALASQQARWNGNADEIAAFLCAPTRKAGSRQR